MIGTQQAYVAPNGQCWGADDPGDPALTEPTLELHLPQTILSMNEAHRLITVSCANRSDVRNSVDFALDVDRATKAGQPVGSDKARQRFSVNQDDHDKFKENAQAEDTSNLSKRGCSS